MPAPTDRVFLMEYNGDLEALLQRLGREVEMVELPGLFDRLNALIPAPGGGAGEPVARFLGN